MHNQLDGARRLAAFALAILLLLAPAARADDAASLQAVVDDLQQRHGVTGLLVGVQRGDDPPVVVAAGTSLPGQAATPDMHARIGAMAITTLTTLAFQLDEEGTVALDTPLGTWFPDYPEADKVTLRMLAGSRSGYFDYVTDETFVDAFYDDVFRTWTVDELMAITFAQGMRCDPGTCFGYSHANFILLGMALEAATGTPLETLVAERVVAPLGLDDIRFGLDAAMREPVLQAYTDERGVFENSTFWSPSWTSATGFFTSDMGDLLGLMRGLASGALLSPESHAAMLEPINVGEAFNKPGFHYAYGILVTEPWLLQAFSFGGYDGMAGYLADEDLTIAVVDTLGPGLESGPAKAIFAEVRDAVAP